MEPHGFYQSPTFGANIFSNSAAFPFQAAGGIFYLVTNSPYRNVGTTNINSSLLAAIKTKTTYPPIVYSNATISVDINFFPQAQRDTDIPDLGYHYDPLDYVFGGAEASANLTFAPGTAVGWFSASLNGDNHGLHLGDGHTASFNGTAASPDYWVRTTTVQELSSSAWNGPWPPGGITGSAWPDFSQAPQLSLRFTRCSILANDTTHFCDDGG